MLEIRFRHVAVGATWWSDITDNGSITVWMATLATRHGGWFFLGIQLTHDVCLHKPRPEEKHPDLGEFYFL